MAKRASKKLIKNVCSVCGKTFYASRPADTCVDNSTCRVKKHQRAEKMKAIERSLMINMDDYAIYAAFVGRYPDVKPLIDSYIEQFGVAAALMTVQAIYAVIAIRDKEWENAIHPTQ